MSGLIAIGVITVLLFLLIFYVSYAVKQREKYKDSEFDAKVLERQRNVKRPSDARSANVWLRKLRRK